MLNVEDEKTTVLGVDDKRLKNGRMRFADDLDVDDDGNIFFSDASGDRDLDEVMEVFIEAKPNSMQVLSECDWRLIESTSVVFF
jgi:hypothetical protein